MSSKKEFIEKINILIEKLSEDELQEIYNNVKEILKLPRNNKTLSEEATIYLLPMIRLIPKDNETFDSEDEVECYINQLNSKYKKIIKYFFEQHESEIINKLLKLEDNKLIVRNNKDVLGEVSINYTSKIKGDYYLVNIVKNTLNNIEEEENTELFNLINDLLNKYNDEEDNEEKVDIYEELYDNIIDMFDKNKMKIPKELRKYDTDISKMDKNIPIIRKYNEMTPDVRFKLYEYYSMKESIENVDDPHKFVFEVEEDTYEIELVLKKIS